MKRRDLLNKISAQADATGACWKLIREGGSHSIYTYNGTRIVVPRHNEINEITAKAILKTIDIK